jgi:hypothetical protein
MQNNETSHFEAQDAITVYPNPAIDWVRIEPGGKLEKIQIFDVNA